MARLIHGVPASPMPRRADPLTDLTLLLSRLQRTILHADAEREARLRESEFEREKARANINYARSLLTRLEQEALAVKVHARRQETQAALVRQREVLDQLSDRLSDLYELAAVGNNGQGGDEDTSDGEDILADIIATPSESLDSTRSPDGPSEEAHERSRQNLEALEPPPPLPQALTKPPQPTQQPTASPAPHSATTPTTTPTATLTATTTSQTLRPRHPDQSPPQPSSQAPPPATATTTSSSLFPTRAAPTSPSSSTAPIPTTEETLLDRHRAEQDALSDSILQLAAQLKASSQAFSAALDEDKEVVDRAGKGMGQAGERMEAVSRRMGALQRMTEGEGWLGRMKLYGMVYGLMVVLVGVVFLGPKLRF